MKVTGRRTHLLATIPFDDWIRLSATQYVAAVYLSKRSQSSASVNIGAVLTGDARPGSIRVRASAPRRSGFKWSCAGSSPCHEAVRLAARNTAAVDETARLTRPKRAMFLSMTAFPKAPNGGSTSEADLRVIIPLIGARSQAGVGKERRVGGVVSIRPRWRLWRGRVGRTSLLWLSRSRR
jgi:hypothetical protein